MLNNNNNILYNVFKSWLRSYNIISEYRCLECGYGQGHQIIWCIKCGNKVTHRRFITYWQCIEYGDLRGSIYFKETAQVLNNNSYITWDDYNSMYDYLESKRKEELKTKGVT